MIWPTTENIAAMASAFPGFTAEVLKAADIQCTIDNISKWYPDVKVGMESVHLDFEFYEKHCFIEDKPQTSSNSILPIIVRKDQKIVAFVTFELESRAKTLTSRLGVVAPECRGEKIGHLGPVLLEGIGKYLNVGLIYYQATLKIPHQQIIAEKMGFQLVGILPAIDIDQVNEGQQRRVYEAVYAKILAAKTEVLLPDASTLTPRTKKLFDLIFSDCQSS